MKTRVRLKYFMNDCSIAYLANTTAVTAVEKKHLTLVIRKLLIIIMINILLHKNLISQHQTILLQD